MIKPIFRKLIKPYLSVIKQKITDETNINATAVAPVIINFTPNETIVGGRKKAFLCYSPLTKMGVIQIDCEIMVQPGDWNTPLFTIPDNAPIFADLFETSHFKGEGFFVRGNRGKVCAPYGKNFQLGERYLAQINVVVV